MRTKNEQRILGNWSPSACNRPPGTPPFLRTGSLPCELRLVATKRSSHGRLPVLSRLWASWERAHALDFYETEEEERHEQFLQARREQELREQWARRELEQERMRRWQLLHPPKPEKKRWGEFFWGNGRGRCAVDLRKELSVSRIACIYVGAWAVCPSVGSSRAGVTVVSRAHTTACPHATAGRRPENCICLAPSEIYVYIWV